ncbi:hypothetical protein ELS07_25620 [Salmonella enterica subsp. enterica serovar Lomalinda]|nr:hypothetical protein [Salmonella enterica subsp. enterica serovar Lomalinda]ECI5321405.1 hypothetical protein [Salmonella enterica subsp. enterica serovar Lomalinda]
MIPIYYRWGVQDEAIDQNNWILTKYIRGEIFIYNPISGVLLYEISYQKKIKFLQPLLYPCIIRVHIMISIRMYIKVFLLSGVE